MLNTSEQFPGARWDLVCPGYKHLQYLLRAEDHCRSNTGPNPDLEAIIADFEELRSYNPYDQYLAHDCNLVGTLRYHQKVDGTPITPFSKLIVTGDYPPTSKHCCIAGARVRVAVQRYRARSSSHRRLDSVEPDARSSVDRWTFPHGLHGIDVSLRSEVLEGPAYGCWISGTESLCVSL